MCKRFLQSENACSKSSATGITCIPDHKLFAVGMNDDVDLGKDE